MKYDKTKNKPIDEPVFSAYYLTNGKREKVELKTCEDVIEYFKYRSVIKAVVCMNKLYVKKAKKGTGKTAKREYGITLKLQYVSAIPQVSSSKSKQSTDDDVFADDDDTTQVNEQSTEKITRNLASLDLDVDEDSDTSNVKQNTTLKNLEDEDDEEEEVVEEPKVVVKPTKTLKKLTTTTTSKTKTAGK
jgi:hypothetical protein